MTGCADFVSMGTDGLFQKSGRGRKPSYAPMSEEDAENELQTLVDSPPDPHLGTSDALDATTDQSIRIVAY